MLHKMEMVTKCPSVTCSQTRDTDRLESNRWVYCIDEQRKQVSNGRYGIFNLNEEDTDGDVLDLQGLKRLWEDGGCFQELVSDAGR